MWSRKGTLVSIRAAPVPRVSSTRICVSFVSRTIVVMSWKSAVAPLGTTVGVHENSSMTARGSIAPV